jgi:hypothetical protein
LTILKKAPEDQLLHHHVHHLLLPAINRSTWALNPAAVARLQVSTWASEQGLPLKNNKEEVPK